MNVANTPQGTGPMTLEQGLTAFKAKQAGTVSVDDLALKADDAEPDPLDATSEGEELTAELEENAEAVSDDESEAEQEKPDTRPIILPDGSEITVEEARKGYLRQSDFTRKTTDLARERENLTVQYGAEMQKVGGLYQQLASLQEKPPTPDQMLELSRTKTSEEFQQIKEYWTYRTAVLNEAKSQLNQHQAQAHRAAKSRAFEVLGSGEIVPGIASEPTWKDPKVMKVDLQKTADWMVELGLDPDSVSGLDNPVAIWIGDMARRQFELQKAQPKAALAVKGKPAPFKPGSKSTASPQSEILRSASEAFRKNPTPQNAFLMEKAKASLRR